MMSLPGTPTLFYGEEIGMGENLDLDGRMAVRTPMQWQPGPARRLQHGARPGDLCRPFPEPRRTAPDQVNVADQRHDPDSLLAFFRERIRATGNAPSSAGAT